MNPSHEGPAAAGGSENDWTFRKRWFRLFVVLSLLLLGTTLVYSYPPDHPLLEQLARLFSLRTENNAATWFSGMLLLLTALHAFDGASVSSNKPAVRRAWTALSLIVLSLSIDEIASIHERIGVYRWLPLLPFALVLLAMLLYALSVFFHEDDLKRHLPLIIAGFAMFGLTVLMEFLEHELQWPERLDGIRAVVEEGIELAGVLMLLRVALHNSDGLEAKPGAGPAAWFEGAVRFRRSVVVAGVVLAPIAGYLTAYVLDERQGHPADWLAASVFLIAALAVWKRGGRRLSWAHPGTAACICVAASLFTVVARTRFDIELERAAISGRGVLFVLLALLFLKTSRPIRSSARLRTLLILVTAATLPAIVVSAFGSFLLYTTPSLMACVMYVAATGNDPAQSSEQAG